MGSILRPESRASVAKNRTELDVRWPAEVRADWEAHLQALIGKGVLSVRTPVRSLLSILDCGRFLTRAEGGLSDNQERSLAEEAGVWTIEVDQPGRFPVFGYLASESDVSEPATRYSLHSAYGGARILLDDGVRERTSVFFGDSLHWIRTRHGAPAPIDAVDELAWPFDRGIPVHRLTLDEGGPDEVVEIQIIDGLSIQEFRAVCFDFDPADVLRDSLDELGIAWRVNPMPEIPAFVTDFVEDRL